MICHMPKIPVRRVLSLYLACVAAVAFAVDVPAGENAATGNRPTITTLGDLNGKRLGVLAGSILDNAANDVLDFTQIVYYDNTEAEIAALSAGEIDAIIDDQPVIRYLTSINPRLRALPGLLMEDRFGFAMRLGDEELYAEVNSVVREMLRDGSLKRMEARWLDSPDDSTRVMPELPPPGTDGVLRFGVSPVSAPFLYANEQGEMIGLELELMQRLSRRINRRLVVVAMDFSNLIPALLDDEVDVIGSGLSITREREKIVRFTDSYYHGGVSAMVLNDAPGEGAEE